MIIATYNTIQNNFSLAEDETVWFYREIAEYADYPVNLAMLYLYLVGED